MFDKESVGLVITQCLGVFGILQYGVKQSAVLANNIKSVENVIEYVLLKKERANDRVIKRFKFSFLSQLTFVRSTGKR